MRHITAPTHIGPDRWPVLSALRVGATDHPAEFAVLADRGQGTPVEPYVTLRVCLWPDHRTMTDGEHHRTFAEAQRRLERLAGLVPMATTTVEVVVVRDPDFANDCAVFIDGRYQPTGDTGAVRVVIHDIDLGADEITGEWVAEQVQRANRLSPAAARYTRATVGAYADDLSTGAQHQHADQHQHQHDDTSQARP